MAFSFRELLAGITTQEAPALLTAPGNVVSMPDALDKLMQRYDRERAKHLHEQGERDKLDLQFEQLRAEYMSIRNEIEGRMSEQAERMREIQIKICDILKAADIKGEIISR